MRLAVVRSLSLIAPLALSAEIVTDRNNVCVDPPEYAVFEGTEHLPGIEQRYIPWGTYTDGGSTTSEFRRVTAKYIGVLASMWDGYFERRSAVTQNEHPSTNAWRYLMQPMADSPTSFADDGEYLQSATNQTRRIPHLFDSLYLYQYHVSGGEYEYKPYHTDGIEPDIRDMALCGDPNSASYDSRQFGSLYMHHVDPPISTEWTAVSPFDPADTNVWRQVWPNFYSLEVDPVIFNVDRPFAQVYGIDWRHPYARKHIEEWLFPEFLMPTNSAEADPANIAPLWGKDVHNKARLLYDGHYHDYSRYYHSTPWLGILPQTNVVEDVLGRDPGWTWPVLPTNDYWIVTGPSNWSVRCDRSFGEWESDEDARMWEGVSTSGDYVEVNYRGDSVWNFCIFGAPCDFTFSGDGTLSAFTAGDYTATKVSFYSEPNVYAHWINGSRRLDWTRLGITCQFLRHMDRSYYVLPEDVAQMALDRSVSTQTWHTAFAAPLPTEVVAGVDYYLDATNIGIAWTYDETLNTRTREMLDRKCYPTARIPAPDVDSRPKDWSQTVADSLSVLGVSDEIESGINRAGGLPNGEYTVSAELSGAASADGHSVSVSFGSPSVVGQVVVPVTNDYWTVTQSTNTWVVPLQSDESDWRMWYYHNEEPWLSLWIEYYVSQGQGMWLTTYDTGDGTVESTTQGGSELASLSFGDYRATRTVETEVQTNETQVLSFSMDSVVIPLDWSALSSNVTLSVVYAKDARAYSTYPYTETRRAALDDFRATPYPAASLWLDGYVFDQDLTSLNTLLGYGAKRLPDGMVGETTDPMTWDSIRYADGTTERLFRLHTESASGHGGGAPALDSHANARWKMLEMLSVKAMEWCGDYGVVTPIDEDFGIFDSDDRATIQSDLADAKYRACLSAYVWVPTNGSPVDASTVYFDMTWADGGVSSLAIDWERTDHQLGAGDDFFTCSWTLTVSVEVDMSVTNNYYEARADGHEDIMSDTRWHFRNLRDPDL